MKAKEANTKIALLMNKNSYAGRQYLSKLTNLDIDVITFGNFSEIDAHEEERCGNLWKPPKEDYLKKHFNFFNFKNLKSKDLKNFLNKKKYEIGIQGGTGILKNEIIQLFSLGILNFHPGDLPRYRGCSAPEWQIFEGNKVVCTCHLIDEGIDTGNIILKKTLKVDLDSYNSFRASIYPEISIFVKKVLMKIKKDQSIISNATIQREDIAIYRKYISQKKIIKIDEKLKAQYKKENLMY